MNVMRGAAKGERERIIVLAHQGAVMARTEKLKPLEYYLKPRPRPSGDEEGAALLAAFERMKARQDRKEG